ncbi:hypothetical protein HYV84_08120 [Candidatus Woesearchaeota archaeon]|nr:hypothetical protein [Candidatus Woesearchaeota archaeon]
MEIHVLEEKNNKLIFEVDQNVGFVNAIKNELWEDEHIKVATYYVNHPLVSKTKFIVETDGADPKKAIVGAVSRLQKLNEKFSSDVKKEIK